MRLRRWEATIRFALADGKEQEIAAGRYFTRWGAKEAMTWKIGSAPVAMLWARGYVQWIRGDVQRV